MNNREFTEWLSSFGKNRLPMWNELPDLDLYMDQITFEVDRNVAFILEKPITKAMINSYVKMEVIDKPEKKKYSRKHLASIIVVSIMKQVFPLDIIKKGINKVFELDQPEVGYDNFVSLFNQEMELLESQSAIADLKIDDDQLKMAQIVAIRSVVYKEIANKVAEFDK
ncbi:hypothetical protein RD055328_12420 [Companilactobacillus sp. RD055328]|uniref:DUF1836 domain-containing protein n=1 Tax=Companilactobacillus sp. RD055328 TaxID=2916634 RepID=UPI001FC80702|nr:DUF1836 domain-containing protein [Companilactobacillus sp. RD055328]GKQ43319.1 hypothetical protein RD055328_12420 [Companilactobacillus sp. RD055328]